MGGWGAEKQGTAVQVQNCHLGCDLRHELFIMLRFREVRARAVCRHTFSVSRPFRLDGRHRRDCVLFTTAVLQSISRRSQEAQYILFVWWCWQCHLGDPHSAFDTWISQGESLLLRDGRGLRTTQERAKEGDCEFGAEIPFGRSG